MDKPFPLPRNVELIRDEKIGLVSNPICRRFFILFRVLGSCIIVGSIVADFTYFFKHKFSSKQLYIAYMLVLSIRCVIPLIGIIKNTSAKVCNKEKNRLRALDYLEPHNEDGISSK